VNIGIHGIEGRIDHGNTLHNDCLLAPRAGFFPANSAMSSSQSRCTAVLAQARHKD